MVVLEAAAIIGIVGWVAAPLFTALINKAKSYAAEKYEWHKGFPEKLESLAHLLYEIGSTVSLVEARRINNPNILCWLSQLKSAIDEVVDLFDILDCDIHLVDPSAEPSKRCIGSADSSKRLKKLVKKLDEIRQSSRGLVQASMLAVTMAGCSDGQSGSISRPVTGPLLSLREPLGYDDQYKLLLTWLVPSLKKPDDEAVVAIVGHGGMGKTTLAQRACKDPEVKEEFDLVIWASVYNKFSEADLLGEIWRSAYGAGHSRRGDMSFGRIQQALEELVASKRYLLVLDGVCNDETATDLQRRDAWSHVLAPFRFAKRGSRVLVTTRALICAQTLGASSCRRLTLDGLDRQSFIVLLKRNVVSGSKDVHRAKDLDEVLGSRSLISEPKDDTKWKRSPLSAKEIGLKLSNTRCKNKWAEILTEDCHEDVIAAHASSYQQLPPHLQHCLAFLSLFPNNFKFRTEKLVKMWIAHDFISDNGETMEETARGYFNDLLFRSFLQPVEKDKTDYYEVHEQIHSMIRLVSSNYFMMIKGNSPTKIPLTVRHLSVTTSYLPHLKNSSVLKKLRTFLVFRDPSAALKAIDEDLLREFNGIRVMDLTDTDIEVLPSDIGNLIHLRYLALPNTIRQQPDLTKLHKLKTPIGCNHAQTAERQHPMNLDLAINFGTKKKKTSLEHLAPRKKISGPKKFRWPLFLKSRRFLRRTRVVPMER